MRLFSWMQQIGVVRSLGLGLLLGLTGCQSAGGWVMNNSGMGYYQKGHFALARNEFLQAVAIDPWNPDYRHNLAMASKRMGDVATAERVLRHNLTLDAMHQPTYHSLAQIMVETGRQDQAIDMVQTWTATQPYVPGAHIEMAWLQRETGNIPGAEQSLRHALQADPQNPIALAQLGQIYQDAGQPMQAAAMYQRSLAINMNQPQVQSRLATLNTMPGNGMQMAGGPSYLPPPAFQGAPSMAMSPPSMMAAGQPMHFAPQQHMVMQPPVMSQPVMQQPMMQQPMMSAAPAVMPPQVISSVPQQTTVPTHTTMSTPVTVAKPAPSSGWQPTVAAAGPVLTMPADPAHAPEMTAGLPVVDPR